MKHKLTTSFDRVGKVIERSGSIPELESHLTGDNELVLRVRAAPPVVRIYNYKDRATADEALSKGKQN